MKSHPTTRMLQTSFYDFYRKAYAPALMAIDVLLKSMDRPLSPAQAADALGMPLAAVKRVMRREDIGPLDRPGFLLLMTQGESAVCRLYQREILRGQKPAYSPEDIAFIYGLDEKHVACVSASLGRTRWPAAQVKQLLARIPIYILY